MKKEEKFLNCIFCQDIVFYEGPPAQHYIDHFEKEHKILTYDTKRFVTETLELHNHFEKKSIGVQTDVLVVQSAEIQVDLSLDEPTDFNGFTDEDIDAAHDPLVRLKTISSKGYEENFSDIVEDFQTDILPLFNKVTDRCCEDILSSENVEEFKKIENICSDENKLYNSCDNGLEDNSENIPWYEKHRVYCGVCEASFSNRNGCERHIKILHNLSMSEYAISYGELNQSVKFICEICNIALNWSKKSLHSHLEGDHCLSLDDYGRLYFSKNKSHKRKYDNTFHNNQFKVSNIEVLCRKLDRSQIEKYCSNYASDFLITTENFLHIDYSTLSKHELGQCIDNAIEECFQLDPKRPRLDLKYDRKDKENFHKLHNFPNRISNDNTLKSKSPKGFKNMKIKEKYIVLAKSKKYDDEDVEDLFSDEDEILEKSKEEQERVNQRLPNGLLLNMDSNSNSENLSTSDRDENEISDSENIENDMSDSDEDENDMTDMIDDDNDEFEGDDYSAWANKCVIKCRTRHCLFKTNILENFSEHTTSEHNLNYDQYCWKYNLTPKNIWSRSVSTVCQICKAAINQNEKAIEHHMKRSHKISGFDYFIENIIGSLEEDDKEDHNVEVSDESDLEILVNEWKR